MRTWLEKLFDTWKDLGTWNQYGIAIVAALLLLWLGAELLAS